DAAMEAHRGTAYLQMDTGLGKSRVGCAVIARLGMPALVVVPTKSIAAGWVDEFAEIFPDLRVGMFANPPKTSKKKPAGPDTHDVVIIIINTFYEKDPEFLHGFGVIVLDEAHEYHSKEFSRALWLCQTKAVLGLSATPDVNPTGMDKYIYLHLGAPILQASIPGFDVGDVQFRGVVRVVEYAGSPAHCGNVVTAAGTMSAIMTIGAVIRDEARLRLVVAEIIRLHDLHLTAPAAELAALGLGPRPEEAATPKHPAGVVRRHGVFVFAEHREYLIAIRDALLARVAAEDIDAPEIDAAPVAVAAPEVSVLRGGVAKADMTRAKRAGAHIVLTTYGFSRRGVSLADMTSIVAATPRRNGSRQLLGRFLRRGSDESIVRQMVDIVDVRTGLKSQLTERMKEYRVKKYPVSRVKCSWEDFMPAVDAAPDVAHVAIAPAVAAMDIVALLAAAAGGFEEEPADAEYGIEDVLA
ncbi:MAG: DEAD/DEAH box helicase family protein, partial [Patescibacteria group bacterium]